MKQLFLQVRPVMSIVVSFRSMHLESSLRGRIDACWSGPILLCLQPQQVHWRGIGPILKYLSKLFFAAGPSWLRDVVGTKVAHRHRRHDHCPQRGRGRGNRPEEGWDRHHVCSNIPFWEMIGFSNHLGATRVEINEAVALLSQVASRNFKQVKLVAIKVIDLRNSLTKCFFLEQVPVNEARAGLQPTHRRSDRKDREAWRMNSSWFTRIMNKCPSVKPIVFPLIFLPTALISFSIPPMF